MTRSVRLTWAAVALFFLLFPLVLGKPGWPPALKADEPAYFLMASSLAEDGDLVLTPEDVDRLFAEFPFGPVSNLIVMTDDGWRTVLYGKPYVYSFLAAPLVRLFGANGLLFLNMLLTVAMTWMGTRYLERFNPPGRSLLFSAGFFFLSAGFAYVFWLQPEVLNMASVTACLFLGLHATPASGGRRALVLAALAGAALAPGVYNKPMLAVLGLPVLWLALSIRRWGRAGAFVAGSLAGMVLVVGGSLALTGHPTPYLGVKRQGVTLCEQGVMPIQPEPASQAGQPDPERPTGGAWSWIFRIPETSPRELSESLTYFLVGRHTGLFLYFPFALLALVLFLLHARRSGVRWVLLASLAAIALFFVLFIPYNWQGGGGFIGNRYYVNAVPGFLFLVTRIKPRWLPVAGFGLGGLLLAPLLFSPFARTGPEPTLQTHVRNFPYPLFPLELSLREVPGYHDRVLGDRRFVGRRDVVLPRGEQLWIRGASDVELYLLGTRPIERAAFQVASPAPDNTIAISMGGDRQVLELSEVEPEGSSRLVVLTPEEPTKIRRHRGTDVWVYRLEIETETGRPRTWTRQTPPASCANFAYNASWQESFFVGATLTYLGDGSAFGRDVYGVRWESVSVPEQVSAGATFELPVRLTNTSRAAWRTDSPVRVHLAYHWLASDGGPLVWNGERTQLAAPVAPGETIEAVLEVTAPAEPGSYLLELDPIHEHVAWFSQRGVAGRREPVQVVGRPSGPEIP